MKHWSSVTVAEKGIDTLPDSRGHAIQLAAHHLVRSLIVRSGRRPPFVKNPNADE
jgi:hypothetical protein